MLLTIRNNANNMPELHSRRVGRPEKATAALPATQHNLDPCEARLEHLDISCQNLSLFASVHACWGCPAACQIPDPPPVRRSHDEHAPVRGYSRCPTSPYFTCILYLKTTNPLPPVTVGSITNKKKRERRERKGKKSAKYIAYILNLVVLFVPWPTRPLAARGKEKRKVVHFGRRKQERKEGQEEKKVDS